MKEATRNLETFTARPNAILANKKVPTSAMSKLDLTIYSEAKVLVIDDFLESLKELSAILSNGGLKVKWIGNGQISILDIETQLPDLILLGVKTSNLDGYTLCHHLKSNSKTQNIPVIFCGALDNGLDKAKVFAAGGIDYVAKPYYIEEVIARISSQLALKAAAKKIHQLHTELEIRVEERKEQLTEVNRKLELEITERQWVQHRLRISEERLESLLESLEEVVWSIEPQNGGFLYLNPIAEKLYGYSISMFFDNPNFWLDVIHPDDRQRVKKSRLTFRQTGCFSEEYRIIRQDGSSRWVSDKGYAIYDAVGNIIRIDGITRDITEHRRAQEKLEYNALHDNLTGLPNRSLFMDRVEQAIKHSKQFERYLFAVLFIDLDRFKLINDSLGHFAGDRFLQVIACILEGSARPWDTVARFGGDKFTILMDNVGEISTVIQITERILQELTTPITVDGQTIFSSASIGIALGDGNYVSSAEILRDADIAMYRAKLLGRGRYILFNHEMYATNLRVMQLDGELRGAIDRQELELHYQPIISLESGKLVGFEALIRWFHSERGMISPSEFIPIAEDSGFITTIGEWTLQQACYQLQAWRSQFPEAASLKMSINLAGHQIKEANLLNKIDKALKQTNLDGTSIRLEITESMLMDERLETIERLDQIQERGVEISIDDFGKGYSSLSYLPRFPINTIKIDRAFISQMNQDMENLEIVRTITTLAHSLGMDVVAEGVEDVKQVEKLQQLGCEFAQGYFFAKPLQAKDAEQFLKKGYWLP